MDVRSMMRQRAQQLGLEQRDLAAAARVTESYISQILTRKKLPPAPDRTGIYSRLERVLRLPRGSLAEMAERERGERLRERLVGPQPPLLKELRELVLRKCAPGLEPEIRAIFERDPFGEVEHLITLKLLEVVKQVVKERLEDEDWLELVARLSRRSYEDLRVIGLDFLDAELFRVSATDCAAFLDPLLVWWRIELPGLALEVLLDKRLVSDPVRSFEYIECDASGSRHDAAGLEEFLNDPALSGDATQEEIAFLSRLRFRDRRPTSLYYYRELQNLRDPIHFRSAGETPARSRRKRVQGRRARRAAAR